MALSFDPTGRSLANLVLGEVLSPTLLSNGFAFSFAIFANGPAIGEMPKLKLVSNANSANYKILQPDTDFEVALLYPAAMGKLNTPVYAGVRFINTALSAVVGAAGTPVGAYSIVASYQSLGGNYGATPAQIAAILTAIKTQDPTTLTWEAATNAGSLVLPTLPNTTFDWSAANVPEVQLALRELDKLGLVVHMRPRFLQQPGSTVYIPTAAEVGLGSVANYPVATLPQAQAGTDAQSYMTPALTASAVNAQLVQLLASMGYNTPTTYAAGLTISSNSASYLYNNDVYVKRQGVQSFVTSGTFEYTKFVKITSLVKDSWQGLDITITGAEAVGAAGEKIIPLGASITTRSRIRVFINNVMELVEGEEAHLDGSSLVVTYPLTPGDTLKVLYKEIKSKQSDDTNVYKTFGVTAIGQQVFNIGTLQFESIDDYRVTVNDWLILDSHQNHYSITNQGGSLGYALVINYPLQVGDVVEFENEDSIGVLGKQALRAALLARTL